MPRKHGHKCPQSWTPSGSDSHSKGPGWAPTASLHWLPHPNLTLSKVLAVSKRTTPTPHLLCPAAYGNDFPQRDLPWAPTPAKRKERDRERAILHVPAHSPDGCSDCVWVRPKHKHLDAPCCFPRHKRRDLNWRWSSQDSNQCPSGVPASMEGA